MGTIYTHLFHKKEEFRIIFQGLDAAGKTSILYKLKLGEVVTTIPTIEINTPAINQTKISSKNRGFNVETIEYRNINITAWDVGGRDKIRPLMRHYYTKETRALVYIVDSEDHERLDQARDELHSVMAEDELKDVVLLVLANKQDLPNAWSAIKIADELQLSKLPTRRLWNIFGVSARTGDQLYEALDWMTTACKGGVQSVQSDSSQSELSGSGPTTTKSEVFSQPSWLNKTFNAIKRVFLAQD